MLMPTCFLWQMFWPLLFMSNGIDMRPVSKEIAGHSNTVTPNGVGNA